MSLARRSRFVTSGFAAVNLQKGTLILPPRFTTCTSCDKPSCDMRKAAPQIPNRPGTAGCGSGRISECLPGLGNPDNSGEHEAFKWNLCVLLEQMISEHVLRTPRRMRKLSLMVTMVVVVAKNRPRNRPRPFHSSHG